MACSICSRTLEDGLSAWTGDGRGGLAHVDCLWPRAPKAAPDDLPWIEIPDGVCGEPSIGRALRRVFVCTLPLGHAGRHENPVHSVRWERCPNEGPAHPAPRPNAVAAPTQPVAAGDGRLLKAAVTAGETGAPGEIERQLVAYTDALANLIGTDTDDAREEAHLRDRVNVTRAALLAAVAALRAERDECVEALAKEWETNGDCPCCDAHALDLRSALAAPTPQEGRSTTQERP